MGAARFFAVALLALVTAACCKQGDAGGRCRAEAVVVDCAKDIISGVAGGIIEDVMAVLAGGGAHWQDALDGLAGKVGTAAVICAVQQARRVATGADPRLRTAHAGLSLKIAERARIYLAARGVEVRP